MLQTYPVELNATMLPSLAAHSASSPLPEHCAAVVTDESRHTVAGSDLNSSEGVWPSRRAVQALVAQPLGDKGGKARAASPTQKSIAARGGIGRDVV